MSGTGGIWDQLESSFESVVPFRAAAQSYAADHAESLHDWLPDFEDNLATLKSLAGAGLPAQIESLRVQLVAHGQTIDDAVNSGQNVTADDANAWLHETSVFAVHLTKWRAQAKSLTAHADSAAQLPGDSLTAPLQDAASGAANYVAGALGTAAIDIGLLVFAGAVLLVGVIEVTHSLRGED